MNPCAEDMVTGPVSKWEIAVMTQAATACAGITLNVSNSIDNTPVLETHDHKLSQVFQFQNWNSAANTQKGISCTQPGWPKRFHNIVPLELPGEEGPV